MAAGPRPAGVDPVCFTPLNRRPTACNPQVATCRRTTTTRSGPASSSATTTWSRTPNFPDLHRKGGNDDDDDDNGSSSEEAVAIWTDARNGRGSGAPTTPQPGRNPACEQSDAFFDFFNPLRRDRNDAVSEEGEKAVPRRSLPG